MEDQQRDVGQIDDDLTPDEEEAAAILELPEGERPAQEAELVAGESATPAKDSEFFNPAVDEDGNEVTA